MFNAVGHCAVGHWATGFARRRPGRRRVRLQGIQGRLQCVDVHDVDGDRKSMSARRRYQVGDRAVVIVRRHDLGVSDPHRASIGRAPRRQNRLAKIKIFQRVESVGTHHRRDLHGGHPSGGFCQQLQRTDVVGVRRVRACGDARSNQVGQNLRDARHRRAAIVPWHRCQQILTLDKHLA